MKKVAFIGVLLGLLVVLSYQPLLAQGFTKIDCPTCKEKTTAVKKGGGITMEKEMVCPSCKGKGTALEPHTCDKCGKEVLLCAKCKNVVAHATEKRTAEVRCPSCKEKTTAVKKGGGITMEKEMVCPSCKQKIDTLGVFVCEKCGKDILACPVCKQYSGIVTREEQTVETRCPSCREKTTATKKGGGITLEKSMECPHCKKSITELDRHVCDKCGAEMLLCPLCRKGI